MKSFNTYFIDFNTTKNFIDKNIDRNAKNLLIQIFTSEANQDFILSLQDFFVKELKNSVLIGATTDGEIMNGKVSTEKTVINFSIFKDTKIRSGEQSKVENELSSYNAGLELTKKLTTTDAKLMILFADGLNMNGEEFLNGCQSVNNNIIVAGGLAGDNGEFKESYVFTKDEIISNGAVGVSLSSKDLNVSNGLNFSWHSIGKEFTVTKSDKNVVYMLDDSITPYDLYKKYLGEDIAKQLPSIGIEFPFILHRNGENIARAVISKNDDGSLKFAGNIEEGDKVKFGIGDAKSIINDSLNLYNNLSTNHYGAIFCYSCMARRRFLQDSIELETKPFQSIAPTAGFFTYGEFFSYHGEYMLLNETLTVLAVAEESIGDSKKKYYPAKAMEKKSSTIEALSHLTNKISNELTVLNRTLEEKVEEKTEDLKQNIELLYKRHYFDSLTELQNRNFLLEQLKVYEKPGFLLIDINEFKNINDLYGIEIGDMVLQKFANILRNIADKTCKVFRLSADEFIFLNTIQDGYEKCKQQAETIISIFEANVIKIQKDDYDIDIHLSVTIGISCNEDNPLEKANMALRHATVNRMPYARYSKELKLKEYYAQDLKWTKIIKNAIQEDRVVPFFQLITDREGKSKYECLMRIIDDDKVIAPLFFLDIAKKARYYTKLTKIMIEKSFEVFLNRHETFSINLSFEDISNNELINFIKTMIEKYKIADRLIFEIVESESINNFELVENFINQMKKIGVRIALDDFGSGYSNFSYLLKLKPDFIKIDGSIIKNIDNDKNSYLIALTITEFAKRLGIKTVAEYIHSEEVYKKAQDLDIDFFQGFYFSAPQAELK